MLIALAYCPRDDEAAKLLLEWINEQGGLKNHELFLLRDNRISEPVHKHIFNLANQAFGKTEEVIAQAEMDGWPEGANYFFRTVAGLLSHRPNVRFFFWMEPDAIPLVPDWADQLEKEFIGCGKPFMGDRVEVAIAGKEVPLHMSGVGFYPNPLHAFAGEAYRAFDVAWDMAAKDQICPRAHFTKSIEHAWKHPSFTDQVELITQIRPEALIFHASKDGSLIKLLRQRSSGKEIPHALASSVAHSKEPDKPGSPSPMPSCDIFIRTYKGDYEWLKYCLKSINKFCTGFRKVWVVSPDENIAMYNWPKGAEWKTMPDETEDGYLAQQITKLYADVITDYQADYIMHVDSDVIFRRPTTPLDFFNGLGQLVWYYTPYSAIETPWKPITEKFLGMNVDYEFMRRFPIMIPRWLYPRIREFCHKRHGMIISDYIRNQPPRAFSEFNVLGAYAYAYKNDMFVWSNTLQCLQPPVFAKQFHSWSGLTPEIKAEIESFLSVPVVADEPLEQSVTERSGEARESTERPDAIRNSRDGQENVPAGIKELPSGIWVITEDTHVSKWVEQEQRLDHDQNTLPFILPHINEGDTVIDVGAFIGDHTLAYARKVGSAGKIIALEPNPTAYRCLVHNLREHPNVVMLPFGASNRSELVPLSGNNDNTAGAYVGDHMKISDVWLHPMNFELPKLDLIKLDCEGCEVKALLGAMELIEAHHPVMIIEVNQVALERQGFRPDDIWKLSEELGYNTFIMQENCDRTSPMYDIICLPPEVVKEPERNQDVIIAPLEASLSIRAHVEALGAHARKNKEAKKYVKKLLFKEGIVRRESDVIKEWTKQQ